MLRVGGWMLAMALLWSTAAQAQSQAQSQAPRTLDGRRIDPAAVDRRVTALMAATKTRGLAAALVRDGRVVWLKTWGVRDTAGAPLTPDTVMSAASLTKATFATFVMQLIDEGKIDLDTPIGDYLPRPLPEYPRYADLAGDDRWRRLTFRILLDHTTGFANVRFFEPDRRLRFHRDPGVRYGYSGEGIGVAQFVLQEGLGIDVAAQMQRRLFAPLGMTRTAMTWRDDLGPDVSQMFPAEGEPLAHRHRSRPDAIGSLDTTPRDWSRFLAAVVRGKGLMSPRAKAQMIRRQVAIDSPAQFPTLSDAATDENRAIRLGYGQGWGVFQTPYGPAFFKEGHDDGAANYALCVEPRKACVLLMSNSERAEGTYKALVEMLMGDVRLPWRWENYIPVAESGG